jgi:F-type H+-transporting ATPase subunit epsilon
MINNLSIKNSIKIENFKLIDNFYYNPLNKLDMPINKIYFQIVTPERVVLKEQILQVTVPTKMGEITVLPNHIPLVATLVPGVIETVNENGEKEIISVSGGFIEVLKDKVVILADTAERAEEIDLERAEAAKNKAEEVIKGIRKMEKDRFTDINIRLATELARTRAVKKNEKIKKIDISR